MQSVLSEYRSFNDLPLRELETKRASIYAVDYDWNYIYANQSASRKLNGYDVVGKNISTVWTENPQFNFQPVYALLKDSVNERLPLKLKVQSPITSKPIEITGYPLEDCYFFSIDDPIDKEVLLEELKTILRKGIGT